MTPWTKCADCDGTGLATNTFTGEPDHCRACGGNGTERARDARGRFARNVQAPDTRPKGTPITVPERQS